MKLGKRKILCFGFDGVLHSYTSGWQGARDIPDPPVPGALEFVCRAMRRFDVAIYSSRSHQWGGRRAMKRWLRGHLTDWFDSDDCEPWNLGYYATWHQPGPEGTRREECDALAYHVVRRIQWPNHKPPAHFTIDDRATMFLGRWQDFDLDEIYGFRPWNKRGGV